MKTVAFVYHDMGAACLEELVALGEEVALVVTHDDQPGENVWFRSARGVAERRGIAVIAPADVNASDVVERIRTLEPDFFLSAMFRQLLGRDLLAVPRRAALNLHPSLLPRFRGRAPINWALVEGASETGITLHHMVERADRGDIVAQRRFAIGEEDTALTLHRQATAAARELVREIWPLLRAGQAPRLPQDHAQATIYGGRKPEDGRIDWRWPARRIYDLVRAVTHPYPGAFTSRGGERLFVWWARPAPAPRPLAPGEIHLDARGEVWVGAGEGALRLERVQLGSGAEMAARDWAARGGCRPRDKLGQEGDDA